MGFHTEIQQFTADGGIDVKATLENELGKTVYAIQVKRYEKPVTVEPVRELGGVMKDFDATNGVFVTTSHFTAPAQEYAERNKITLIDGGALVNLTKKYQLFGQKAGKQVDLKEFVVSVSGLVFLIASLKH
jgi:restriction endonuclease Mrr